MRYFTKEDDYDENRKCEYFRFTNEKKRRLVRCVEMTTERVKTAEVELEDTYMIEDENDKSIEEQKCSDQYEKYKDHLETITEKLNYHNEVESYLGVICELNIQKVRLHNA